MNILGIHDGHNAAAALLRNGEIVFALQEERLTRVKNQGGPPAEAVKQLLAEANLSTEQLDAIALNGNYMTYEHWERENMLQSYAQSSAVKGQIRELLKDVPGIDAMYQRLKEAKREETLAGLNLPRNLFKPVEHHLAHASAAYYGWGRFDAPVLVLTCDGSGDRLCATVSIGEKGRLTRIAEIDQSHSIGRLYASITYLMGMVPLEHEYKVMGLAPYAGDAPQVERVYKKFASLFEWHPNNPLCWQRAKGVPNMYNAMNFISQLITRERFDWIGGGLQRFVQSFLTEWVKRAIRETQIGRVALSGGVFMNVKLNQALLALPEVEDLFIFPSCGDETNAIGAAYNLQAQVDMAAGNLPKIPAAQAIYWGRAFSDEAVEDALKTFPFSQPIQTRHPANIEQEAAQLLAQGHTVARAKGRMEFGARALGNRSILAPANSGKVVKLINEMIKKRDFWMPFAPSILSERLDDYVVRPKPVPAPYMIIAFDTHPHIRDTCEAALHPYDSTCRPQEVIESWNPNYHALLSHYQELTGEGIILNTSFNLHGYPIVYSPQDALHVLDQSGLTHLALGNVLVQKKT